MSPAAGSQRPDSIFSGLRTGHRSRHPSRSSSMSWCPITWLNPSSVNDASRVPVPKRRRTGPPPDQRHIGESWGRILEKGPGGGAESLDDRATDHIGVVGRRSSRAVIARLVFRLDDRHPAGWRKAPGERRSHHACANDDDVKCGHGSRLIRQNGAEGEIRTPDLLITNQLLCH